MGTVWRSRLTLSPNPANCGTTVAAAAWMMATMLTAVDGPAPPAVAPPQKSKEPPLSGPKRLPAPPLPAREGRRAKANSARKVVGAPRSMRHGKTWTLSYWSSAAPTPQSSTHLRWVAAFHLWPTPTLATSLSSAAQTWKAWRRPVATGPVEATTTRDSPLSAPSLR